MSLFNYEEEMKWIEETAKKDSPKNKQKWETAKEICKDVNEISLAIQNIG